MSTTAKTAETQQNTEPISQEKQGFRRNWPAWAQQLPRLRFPPPSEVDDSKFQLIDPQKLQEVLRNADPEAVKRIQNDIVFLDHELLRLFRNLDYQAKFEQNRYRVYQLTYMLLAAAATLVGSFLALALNSNPIWVPWLAFIETLIALATAYMATVSGREPPMPRWMSNRRKAEHLRREYFRYLMRLPPYDKLDGYKLKQTLSVRAADINRGFFPEMLGADKDAF
jgi:hypothetical protein